jgi:uncharacterized membrane protein YidH (DUF202 family)
MGNLIVGFIFSIFFFYMWLRSHSELKKASPTEFAAIWSFLSILMLVFFIYFFLTFLWTAAYLIA